MQPEAAGPGCYSHQDEGHCQLQPPQPGGALPQSGRSLSVCQSVSLSVCQSVSLSVCQSVSLSVCQSVSLSVKYYDYFSVVLVDKGEESRQPTEDLRQQHPLPQPQPRWPRANRGLKGKDPFADFLWCRNVLKALKKVLEIVCTVF